MAPRVGCGSARLRIGSLARVLDNMSLHRRFAFLIAVALMGGSPTSELQGQQPSPADPTQDAVEAAAQEPPGRVSPGGAALRSFLVPGWGQAAAGATHRGAVYFTLESLGLWMILKTSKTLGSARDIEAMQRLEAEERLIAGGTVDPLSGAIDADLAVRTASDLVEIRKQQREDWVAFGVFFLLLGGADAFVAAHLADFPDPLETAIRPLPNMGVELGFRLTLPTSRGKGAVPR